MGRDDQNFHIRTHKPVEDVVRETRHAKFANIWWQFDAIPVWGLTDFLHRLVKSQQVACTETYLTRLVIGNMFKMLNTCRIIEEVAHLSKAWA